MSAIETRSLCRRFGERVAVADLSLLVEEGDIFGFLGPNGSGKTTTLRMVTGILMPTVGEARVLGIDVRARPEEVKRTVAYLPQREALYGDLTALENVTFALSLHGLPRRQWGALASDALETLRLPHLRDRRAAELSGGERRLLALASVLAVRQPLLFLDEPTAGLDPERRALVWEVLHALREAGVTVCVTTHHMEEADRCRSVGLMSRGRLCARGTPAELRSSFPHRIYKLHGPDVAARVAEVERALSARRSAVRGAGLRVVTDLESPQVVSERLASGGMKAEVRPVEPDLEDVFLALTAQPEKASWI